MRTSHLDRAINVILRIITLGIRFVFIILMAKLLEPAAVGYYGLFAATIGYVMLFAGLDFYTYATREIVRAPIGTKGQMLKAQAVLIFSLYLILVPSLAFVLFKLDWPLVLMWWFVPILLLEHLNQEISRVLIALSEQISASVILFMRQGSWAIALVLLMIFVPESRQLEAIFPAWALAGVIAATLGCWKLRRLDLGGWRIPIDWVWVRRGIYVSAGFLTATMALRATQTVDRYWIEALTDVETLAAYVLFFGISASMMTFLDAGVFAFAYPTLIRLHHDKSHLQARRLVRQTMLQTLAVTCGFVAISWVILPHLIAWINNPIYEAEIGLYPWLLSAMVVNGIGLVPHYALYAKGIDRPIIQSHIAGLGTFIIATWSLSSELGGLAVPVGLLLSFLIILGWKSISYLKVVSLQPT